jgi:hypothetical protein
MIRLNPIIKAALGEFGEFGDAGKNRLQATFDI